MILPVRYAMYVYALRIHLTGRDAGAYRTILPVKVGIVYVKLDVYKVRHTYAVCGLQGWDGM